MKKVPITDVINSWLKADARLEEQCKEEICEYDSNSAYKGYMLGFEDGVQSQINEDASKCIITKQDIADGFKLFKSDSHSLPVVSEADWQYISSSDQYWLFAGAMWVMNQLKNKIDGDR